MLPTDQGGNLAVEQLKNEQLCGQLILCGFEGHEPSASFEEALSLGRRAGAILFRRNLRTPKQIAALSRQIIAAAPAELPVFMGVDQEGGRVTRMPPPFLSLPPMRQLALADDVALTRRLAKAVASELSAFGINLNFAPVMDVDSREHSADDQPIIGDRAFGSDPRTVARHGVAFIQGLQEGRVVACAKHFPGHGDTIEDSHFVRPTVDRSLDELRHTELPPFRAASGAGIGGMMTAHVVYPALEPDVPATFSRAICASLLRGEIGFDGVLFSDDLEMGAISKHHDIETAAQEAIWAGCDMLLICKDEHLQDRAHRALVARADHDPKFLSRCQEAVARSLRVRRACPARVLADERLGGCVGVSGEIIEALAAALAEVEIAPKATPSGRRLCSDVLDGSGSTGGA